MPNAHNGSSSHGAMVASQRQPPSVLGLGHPLLDITSHVGPEYLERYNIPIGSCNLATKEQLPLFEDLSQRRDVEFVPGGAAMNTVRVTQWASRGEVPSHFVGSLGDDEFGGILERALTRAGVGSVFEYHEELQTGTCACLICDGGERSLLANLGAAVNLSMDHILSSAVSEVIAKATLFYCEGFFLNTISSPKNALLIGEHCLTHDKTLAFNLSAPYLCHAFKDRWTEIMPFIDVLFGSRLDAEAYNEAFGWGLTELKDMMTRMADLPKRNGARPRLVVITGGSSETFVATRESFATYSPIPVAPEEIVDTNGAGDSFVGGFLALYARGAPLDACVELGHQAAAIVLRYNGCTFPTEPPEMPSSIGKAVA